MHRAKTAALNTLRGIAILVLLVLTLFPFAWMIVSSFKTNSEVLVSPPRFLPERPTLENYEQAFQGTIGTAFVNSLMATGLSVVLVLLLAVPAAYALASHRFPGDLGRGISVGFLLLRFLPPFAIVVPVFVLMRSIGLLDSVLALVLVYTAIHLPIAIWIVQPAVRQIPPEIIEAARIDGAGPVRIFLNVVVPLLRPAMATSAAFAAIFAWNEFIFALVLSTVRARTFPVLVSSFVTESGPQWGVIAAVAVLATVPVVLLFVFLQRHLISGLAAGAVR